MFPNARLVIKQKHEYLMTTYCMTVCATWLQVYSDCSVLNKKWYLAKVAPGFRWEPGQVVSCHVYVLDLQMYLHVYSDR